MNTRAIPQSAGTAGAEAALRHYGRAQDCEYPAPMGPQPFTPEELDRRDGRGRTMRELLLIQAEQISEMGHAIYPHVRNALQRWALAANRLATDPRDEHEVPRGTDLDNFVGNYTLEAARLHRNIGPKKLSTDVVEKARHYEAVVYRDATDQGTHRIHEAITECGEKRGTFVLQCGSHWAGDDQSPLWQLFSVMETHPLDLGAWGVRGFVDTCSIGMDGEPIYPPGFVSFQGNFGNLSYGFHVVTNDREVIEDLEAAIRRNVSRQQRWEF